MVTSTGAPKTQLFVNSKVKLSWMDFLWCRLSTSIETNYSDNTFYQIRNHSQFYHNMHSRSSDVFAVALTRIEATVITWCPYEIFLYPSNRKHWGPVLLLNYFLLFLDSRHHRLLPKLKKFEVKVTCSFSVELH